MVAGLRSKVKLSIKNTYFTYLMTKAIKNQRTNCQINIPQAFFYLRTNRKQMKLGHTKKLENNTYNSKIIFKLSLYLLN